MEQHGDELDDENKGKEEHEDQTDRFELEIFFCDVYLKERTVLHLFLNRSQIGRYDALLK